MYVPELLVPFDWTMALLLLVWLFICAAGLQGTISYCRRKRDINRRNNEIKVLFLGPRDLWSRGADAVFKAARAGQAVEDLLDEIWGNAWRQDRQLVILLGLLKQLATLLGLAGTVCGVLSAFENIQGNAPNLGQMGPAIALALKTTLYGAICACICLVLERLPFRELQIQEQKWAVGALATAKARLARESDGVSNVDL